MGPAIAIFQHAASEGPGRIADWLRNRGFALDFVRWWESPAPRFVDHWQGAVILGGAMNIYQHRDYPWLVEEKKWLREMIQRELPLLGICLGAQLLADLLGSRVVQNAEQEIGWWPVRFTAEACSIFPDLPAEGSVLHWHGDTFALPPESIRLGESAACAEQGFIFRENVMGLQFHPEVDEALLVDFCGGSDASWPEGKFVQPRNQILQEALSHMGMAQTILEGCLEKVFGSLAR